MVEFVSYDNEYQPDKALQGAKKLVAEEDVKFVMMLGGSTWPGVQKFFTRNKMLTSTLLPSDLNPNSPYHLAPCEVHPIYNVTGVEWLAENFPKLKKAVICAQDDELGIPSVATYRAAFEVAGIEVVGENIFDIATTDFAPIVTSLLAQNPDIFCFDTAYPDYVNLICAQLYQQGYKGKMISCTLDNYPAILEKTSKDFLEGFITSFRISMTRHWTPRTSASKTRISSLMSSTKNIRPHGPPFPMSMPPSWIFGWREPRRRAVWSRWPYTRR